MLEVFVHGDVVRGDDRLWLPVDHETGRGVMCIPFYGWRVDL